MGILKYVAGLLYSNDKLVSVVGETAVNGGIESGSNANGSYVKYPDGTMICYIDSVFTGTFTVETWTYPIAFVSIPSVQATVNHPSNALYCVNIGSPTVSSVGLYKGRVDTHVAVTDGFYIACTAIGRWK